MNENRPGMHCYMGIHDVEHSLLHNAVPKVECTVHLVRRVPVLLL